ncbi:MAG: hypothetical protein JXA75_06045 [Candidatus Thermoplasmatota archaeon]|nr:hypothetical protein [Candidatus Thermoplasmatota archaeon]
MKQGGKLKIFGASVFFLLLAASIGSIAQPTKHNAPLGILEYDPQSHDFGDMHEGETNNTVFDIWTSGGCCELTFNLTWDCDWITVFPTSGVTNGEHVPITVTIDTTGLDNDPYTGEIFITTNGGGDGIFTVSVNVRPHTYPSLAFSPQTTYFGMIPENVTEITTFDIWNSGSGTLTYSLYSDAAWAEVTPSSGSSQGEHDTITVTITTAGMTPGETYQCYIHINSNGGDQVFFVWFIIGTTPIIEISSVTGGLFRLNAVVKNTGTADALGVEYTISLGGNGLVLLGKETTGKIVALAVGSQRTISSGLILGFGNVEVTVTIQNGEMDPVMKKISADLILFYIKM